MSDDLQRLNLSVDATPFGCFVYSKNIFFNSVGDAFLSEDKTFVSLCRTPGITVLEGPNTLNEIIECLAFMTSFCGFTPN